ncbi:MAG: GAF domain-containing protein [Oscillospiraceae bacterium]|nr:GAF domain-containing protein [Oscillospiraceae bacterium]
MEEKRAQYAALAAQIQALLDGEDDWICAMANVSAAIFDMLPELNWAGFYRVKDGNLILGPFQGKVACTRIAAGKGVCGTALATGESQLVPDVHAFPGHIACDSASNSEVVVPLRGADGQICAVLDIDSPVLGRFDETDLQGFEAIGAIVETVL